MIKGFSFGIVPEQRKIEQEETCKVFGKDILLTQKHEIEYYKSDIREFELSNLLLGTVDNNGKYIIGLKIKKDLIKIEKEIIEETQDRILAFSHILKKDMHFVVEIEEIDDKNIKASLFLNEKVSGYEDFSSLRSFVGSITLEKSTPFMAKIFSVFHLSATASKLDEGVTARLTVYLQDMINEKICLDDIMEIDSQIYVMRMLKLLEKEGEKGKKVLSEFKEASTKQGLDKNVPNRALKMRKLLDKIVEMNDGEKEVFKAKEELVKIKKEYTSTIKRVIDINKDKQAALHNPKASQEQGGAAPKKEGGGAAAKKTAAKPASKPAGKKDAKKDDKKKEDKKKDEKKKPNYLLKESDVTLAKIKSSLDAAKEDVEEVANPKDQPLIKDKKEIPKEKPKQKNEDLSAFEFVAEPTFGDAEEPTCEDTGEPTLSIAVEMTVLTVDIEGEM